MALIIGHSQTKYFSNYIKDSDTLCLSFSGCRVENLIKQNNVPEAVAKASVVCIVCGINNIYYPNTRDSDEQIIGRFETLYDSIKEINPECKVIFSEVLHVSSNHHSDNNSYHPSDDEVIETNRLATFVNTALSSVADVGLYRDVTYVSHSTFRKTHLAKDGLHLSYEGTKLVTENIECVIKSVTEECIANNDVPSYSQIVTESVNIASVHSHNNVHVPKVKIKRNKKKQFRNTDITST